MRIIAPRTADINSRLAHAADPARAAEWPVRTCADCGIFLLPGEATICRHCRDGRPRDDPE